MRAGEPASGPKSERTVMQPSDQAGYACARAAAGVHGLVYVGRRPEGPEPRRFHSHSTTPALPACDRKHQSAQIKEQAKDLICVGEAEGRPLDKGMRLEEERRCQIELSVLFTH
jgi:hypothetical protein